MTSIPTAHTFLESVAGYSQYIAKNEAPNANAPIRLAVIDPAYVASSYPGTLPKVTFEGEDSVTEKRYLVVDTGYSPLPSDRVVMLPAGATYVIVGPIAPVIETPVVLPPPPSQLEFTPSGVLQTTSSGSYATWITVGNVTVPTGVTDALCQVFIANANTVTNNWTGNGRLKVGTAVSNPRGLYGESASTMRYDWVFACNIAGLSAGSRSVTIETKLNTGTGGTRVDAGSLVAVRFDWVT
jgi:hypothetical protein